MSWKGAGFGMCFTDFLTIASYGKTFLDLARFYIAVSNFAIVKNFYRYTKARKNQCKTDSLTDIKYEELPDV